MPSKKTYIALGVVVLGLAATLAFVVVKNKSDGGSCPKDLMLCPDGSVIARSGPSCQFSVCNQTVTSETKQQPVISTISSSTAEVINGTTTPVTPTQVTTTANNVGITEEVEESIFKKITTAVTETIAKAATAVSTTISSTLSTNGNSSNSGNVNTQQTSTNNNQQPQAPQVPTNLNETKYVVQDGTIVDTTTNTVIYTIPPSVAQAVGSSTQEWETHTVNVVPVGEVAPVLNAIPITGLPGKYYLSENSFGSSEDCQFANKIYILDITTNEVVLLYEENSNTLSKDDPRSCNSEIYLLATEDEKLILKYHTLNTNMLCDSSWSEPEKTWYLDVTKLNEGMKRYTISQERYDKAEQEEQACRDAL